MANAFKKAAEKAAAPGKPQKGEEVQFVPEDEQILEAVDDFIKAADEMKQRETDKKVASSKVLPFGREQYFKLFSDKEIQPEKVTILSKSGKSVKFIAQDRAGTYDIQDEVVENLANVLGKDKTEDIVERYTEYSFDDAILNKPKVMDILSDAIVTLVTKKILTQEQADSLLKAKARQVLKKGILARLATICENDPKKMEMVADLVGSNITTYIQ